MLPVSAVLTLKEVQVCVGDVDHKSIGVQTASVFLKKKEGGTEEGGRDELISTLNSGSLQHCPETSHWPLNSFSSL